MEYIHGQYHKNENDRNFYGQVIKIVANYNTFIFLGIYMKLYCQKKNTSMLLYGLGEISNTCTGFYEFYDNFLSMSFPFFVA